MADRTLRARLILDTSGMERGIDGISSKMGKLGGALSGIGATLVGGLVGAGVGELFNQMISGASNLEETMSKSRVVFGAHASEMESWASTATKSLGMTKQQALESSSSFANMFQQLGIGSDKAMDMSKSVVQMTTDFASFHNVPVEEVNTAIAASFRGEYDALQRFVPTINAAAVEQEALAETGKKSAKELNAQEKATATLTLIQKGGASAQGDFARTSDSFANQQKILNAQISESAAQIGSAFLPILASLMSFISGTVIPGIMNLVNWMKENSTMLGIVAGVIGAVLLPMMVAWGIGAVVAGVQNVVAWVTSTAAAITGSATQAGAQATTQAGWVATGIRAVISSVMVIGSFVGMAISAVVNAAIIVGAWIVMGVQSLLAAGRMALAWIIAMGPIGWIIAAVIALVALIIANWETIKTWTINIWNTVWQFIEGVWNNIKDAVAVAIQVILWIIAPLPMLIITHWETIKNATLAAWSWIQEKITAVINFVGAIINWVWLNVIKPTFDFIDYAIRLLGATFEFIGRFIAAGWQGMGDLIGRVWQTGIKVVFDAIGTALDVMRGWWQGAVDAIGKIWEGLKELARGPVKFVIDVIWNNGLRVAWNTLSKLWGAKELDKVNVGFAKGGAVSGPGTGKSDSILALLSAGEHVWTADEVRKAGGHGSVAELRRRIGAYAGGGPVGGVQIYQQLATLAAKMVPGTRMSSGYRAGDPGYHGAGKAADLVGNLAAINQAIAQRYPNATELIYTPGVNIKNGRQITYSPAVRADHYDHVHWAMESLTGDLAGSMAAGVGIDPAGMAKAAFDAVMGTINSVITQFGDSPLTKGIVEMGKQIIGKLVEEGGKKLAEFFNSGGGGAPGAGVEQWRGLVVQALGMMRQPASLADTVLRRMNQESGGNARAINNWDSNAQKGTPSKGLMQVIDPTFASYRDPALPNDIWNPLSNIIASMRYAISRYGTLGAAFNRKGGYLLGGMVTGAGGLIGVHGGEFVVNSRLVDAIKRGNGNGSGNTYNLTVINAANSEVDLREQFRRMELMEGSAYAR